MAGSVNKVILVGNLGANPEVRTGQSGSKFATLSLATSENWKDRNTGERKERTEWHRVAIYNDALANLAEKYLQKGSKVYIEGKLETRKWQDNNGQDRYTTEVTLRPYSGEMTFLDRAGENNMGGGQGGNYGGANQNYGGNAGPNYGAQGGSQQQQATGGAPNNQPPMEDFEDDIPF